MKNYIKLMSKIIKEGETKGDTLSLFGETLDFDLQKGFPIITTRKINFSAVKGELTCFLRGFTDIRSFNKEGVNFWNADCSKESWVNNPNRKHNFDLGKIYGFQWKEGFGFDQISSLVSSIKNNPESRRHILITFNPRDLSSMCLPPCYISHQFYSVNGRLDMLVHQRSADYCIGVPFDIASFALFQSLMAKEVGLSPGKLKIVFGDVHIYKKHLSLSKEQVLLRPKKQPSLSICKHASILDFYSHQANLEGYNPRPSIKYAFQVQS